tara:strand:- start:522 stop:644 length:123 start_codon:yes stop_codon:yes gene_type:complete
MARAAAQRSASVAGVVTALPGPLQRVELIGQTSAACASAM